MAPKIPIILFILCLAVAIGCKKKNTPKPAIDQIETHEFNPALEITSTDTFVNPPGSDVFPIPSDSSASYLLDVNGDSVPDFNFTVKHWYQWASASNPGANYSYQMSISGLQNSEVAVTVVNPGFSKAKFYAFGESISSNQTWKNSATLVLHAVNTGGNYADFSGTKYIGLRIKKYTDYHYCWLKITKKPAKVRNKLLIESYGFNKSLGYDIATGQEE
ncbi:hypothetical protein D3C87_269440 [compost metagenome]